MSNGILDIDDHGEVYKACKPISPKWRDIGADLGVLENTLAIIEDDYSRAERRMSAVIDKWLRRPKGEVDDDGVLPTWGDFCIAVSRFDRVLAEGIALKHGCNYISPTGNNNNHQKRKPVRRPMAKHSSITNASERGGVIVSDPSNGTAVSHNNDRGQQQQPPSAVQNNNAKLKLNLGGIVSVENISVGILINWIKTHPKMALAVLLLAVIIAIIFFVHPPIVFNIK